MDFYSSEHRLIGPTDDLQLQGLRRIASQLSMTARALGKSQDFNFGGGRSMFFECPSAARCPPPIVLPSWIFCPSKYLGLDFNPGNLRPGFRSHVLPSNTRPARSRAGNRRPAIVDREMSQALKAFAPVCSSVWLRSQGPIESLLNLPFTR